MIDASVTHEEDRLQLSIVRNMSANWAWRWPAPAAIFLLAFALRIFRISHESVDGDEAFSMMSAHFPMGEMIRRLVEDYVHPPLHYLVLRCWFKLFGFGMLQARLPSALFSILSVVLLYVFAKYLFERRTALLSSLLLAISQLAIMFAQQARPYALFHFLALFSSYLFVRALREERALYWWGFVGSSILALYADYFAAFLIAGLVLYAVLYRKRYRLRCSRILAGVAMWAALFIPWATSGIFRQAMRNPKTFAGSSWFADVHWYTVLTAVNSFNNGKLAGLRLSAPLWTFVVGGLLFGVPILVAVKNLLLRKGGGGAAERLDREGAVIVSILWLLPLCLVIGLDFIFHIPYNVRYVLFCAAPYYVLVARGISELRSNMWRRCLVLFILLYSASSLQANYFRPLKENWRDAFAYVERKHKQGDCGIFLPAIWAADPASAQWTITQAGRPSPFRVITTENLTTGSSQCGRVWVIVYLPHNREEWRVPAEADARPLELTHSKIEQQRYFGVLVSLYGRDDAGSVAGDERQREPR